MIRQSDGIYRLDHAVTATQRNILRAFGLDAKSILREALFLSDELAKVDGIRF